MNVDRLVREIVERLETLPENELALVAEVVHQELAREQRYRVRELTVESERERREEAEGLREAIEAINRSLRLDETAEEVLKQVDRLALSDIAEIALSEGEGRFRVVGVRQSGEFVSGMGRTLPAGLTAVLSDRRWCGATLSTLANPACDPGGLLSTMPSWCALPLIVEAEVVGGLLLGSNLPGALDEAVLHRVRALAFSASAALQRAHRHEQVRLYAALLEQVILVHQKAFAGEAPWEVARALLSGALQLGEHPAGILVLEVEGEHRIVAVSGLPTTELEGRPAPVELHADAPFRIEGEALGPIAAKLALPDSATSLYLVPMVTAGAQIGTLVIVDPNGETPDDRMLEAYSSRAGIAYQFALEHH